MSDDDYKVGMLFDGDEALGAATDIDLHEGRHQVISVPAGIDRPGEHVLARGRRSPDIVSFKVEPMTAMRLLAGVRSTALVFQNGARLRITILEQRNGEVAAEPVDWLVEPPGGST